MASAYSSDEESDLTLIPDSVTDYQFVDKEGEAISFADLPYNSPNPESPQVYLRGSTEDWLQKVYQPVVAWKLEISQKIGPDVFVLSNGKWLRLLKPWKVYEDIIRSILISIQALHFLRWNPNSVEKSLWDNLRRVFDKFQVRPSEDDFRPHIALMKQIAEKDEALVKSQLLKSFLEGKGRRGTGEGTAGAPEVKQPFIAEDDEMEEERDAKGDESEEEDADLFDSVCSICDNGGDLLCCEGECMRSFHATEEAGEDSVCESLGLTSAQVGAIQNFLCKNCKVKRHQCFACGKLGNSDKSKGAEVFQCSNATCGYFYHPNCVAKLLFPDDDAALSECEKTVLEGRFVCPYHRCAVCKKLEVKADRDLQFAVCRRCPKSFHRKCLPRKISFTADPENGIMIRAWEDLLPNRILIYCLKHKIDEQLLTPRRDHIVFPETFAVQEKANVRLSEVPSHKQKRPLAKRHESPITTNRETSLADRRPLKKRTMLSEEVPSSKGRGVGNTSQLGKGKAVTLRKVKKLQENDLSRGEAGGAAVTFSRSPSPREVATGDLPSCSGSVQHSSFPVISATVENKMKEFLEKESVTVKDVLKRQTMPQTHQYRHIEKVTRGKIERSVEAIQTAYQKIIEGGRVDDAKAVCEPEVVKQVAKWHKKLGVHLSPFLHGMRYTSFGRHFTKEEKLQEICCKLQWYVRTNDTIVDFCCGSNDFSRIMKEKMDASGKRCNFKNYDIVPPKDDFCYEKRDWMTVRQKELPDGESLIMGLNPPFGTKAGLANKFIDKALTFNPKLVILIVPKETERLDQKRTPYDLVWVDSVMLSGMSFYLPGSVDVNDKQMDQWNVSPPLLYLWSRSDWTARHKAIAEEHGHFTNPSQDMLASPPHPPPPSEEEQKEAKDIISQVVGDISVINNEVMERQEDVAPRKGKGKVDPGPHELENRMETGPTVMKKEGKDVGAGTIAIEEVKKGSLEGMGFHREARGIKHQNEGRRDGADQNPGASRGDCNLQMENNNSRYDGNDVGAGTTAIEEVKKGSLEGMVSHREARGIKRQNEGRGGRADPNPGASSPLKEPRVSRGNCNLQMENNNGRYDGKDVGAGTTAIEEVKKGSLEGMVSHREARGINCQNEGRGGRADQNPGAGSPLKEPRANRGNNTLQMENNNGRYDGSSNRGIDTLQRENHNTASGDRADQNSVAGGPLKEPRSNRGNSTLQMENNNGRYDGSLNRGIDTLQMENYNTAGGGRADQNSGAGSPFKEPRANRGNSTLQMENINGRHDGSSNRGIDTLQRENNNGRYDGSSNRGIDTLQRENNNGRYDGSSNRGIDTLQRENNNGRYDGSSNRGIDTLQRENYNTATGGRADQNSGAGSPLKEPRANRGNSTLQMENNNGRYYGSSNRGIDMLVENHNTASGDILPMAGFQYNDPLIEQPIETRQLDSQLDFSDLGPILSNGNDDFNDMTRRYPTSSSYDWTVASGLGSGSGSGSILEYNRGRVSDYMDTRGFDDFEGLGRFYGSHDENRHNNFGVGPISQPGSTFNNGTSFSSYGLSGLGGSMSTSAMDRYAPRLDDTNFLPPGGSLGFSGGSRQFHQGLGGFGGLSGHPPYSNDLHGVDRRDMLAPAPPHPNLSGFGPRQLHPFQPPGGSSGGGWIDD